MCDAYVQSVQARNSVHKKNECEKPWNPAKKWMLVLEEKMFEAEIQPSIVSWA